jgi:RNA polymerase sigma-70 factor (ECF subfamily)
VFLQKGRNPAIRGGAAAENGSAALTDRTSLVEKEQRPDEDRELVARCREGDPLAFEELVRKHQQMVFNLAYHYLGHQNDIEDVAQKIFTKVYFSLPKFDMRRPFFPWLYRIAINQCYDELRRLRRMKIRTFSELSIEESNSVENLISQQEGAPAAVENQKEMVALLYRLLDQLPEQQRLAVVLRDIENIPYFRMAEMLNCTEQAARLKVFRARSRLKSLVDKALKKVSS